MTIKEVKRDSSCRLARMTPQERIKSFWSKTIHPSAECWVWIGATIKSKKARYGHFWNGKKNVLAHRFSYEIENGPIPKGMTIDHECKTTLCVRPSHLRIMTLSENIKLGGNSVRTHCKRGHAFNKKNTYHPKQNRNHRICRRCLYDLNENWRKRQK